MVSKTELYSIETKNKIITVAKHLFNIPLKPVSMTRFVRLVLLHWFKTFPSLMLDVIEESLVNLHQAVLQISPEPTNKTHSKEDQKPKQIKQEEDKQIKKRHKKSDDRKFRKIKSEITSNITPDIFKKQHAVIHILSLLQMIANKVTDEELLLDRAYIHVVNILLEHTLIKNEIEWILEAYPLGPDYYPFSRHFHSLPNFFQSSSISNSNHLISSPKLSSLAALPNPPTSVRNSSPTATTTKPKNTYSIAKGRERRKLRRSSLRGHDYDTVDEPVQKSLKIQERHIQKTNSIANARERRIIRKPKRIRDDEDNRNLSTNRIQQQQENNDDEEDDNDDENEDLEQEDKTSEPREIDNSKKRKKLPLNNSNKKSPLIRKMNHKNHPKNQNRNKNKIKFLHEKEIEQEEKEIENENLEEKQIKEINFEQNDTPLIHLPEQNHEEITLETESTNFFNSLKS